MITNTAKDASVERRAETQWIYRFGNGRSDGSKDQKALLGGKGANLSEMSRIGLPVPSGFTITTEACEYVVAHDGAWPAALENEVRSGVTHIEEAMGRTFGDPSAPLLVSVRSGAALSMPGMMDSVLNLGMNDEVVEGLARQTGNERFAYDAYRRLIDMFGDVVVGINREQFEQAMTAIKRDRGVENDTDLTADDLHDLVDRYKAIYRKATGRMFPEDPWDQLRLAIDAVFGSWTNTRAVKYRQINKITGLKGTAVNVQAMVYGNMGRDSGTGVCFTRNPATGEKQLYGEFLLDAQGEDVVAGIRTPKDIAELERLMPEMYDELTDHTERLERHYGNMQDIEFTVQNGELFILQTRDGKRTGRAAIQIAVDMVDEGVISKAAAVRRLVEPRHVEQLLHPQFEKQSEYAEAVLGTGLPASPGAAVGRVVFTADDAEAWNDRGESVILVRVETSPEDIGGMDAAKGILTSRGGMTSHAAVVARGWGKPCVAGCDDIVVNVQRKTFTNGNVTIAEGDWISINGTTGEVILGQQPVVDPELSSEFSRFMGWADEFRDVGVRANADTPEDAKQALDLGAEGIGLARTEHMFFGDDRIAKMQRMILADSNEERTAALEALLPLQRQDFAGLFRVMNGRPVTIRLLDPPLHEFLPHDAEEQEVLAERLGIPVRRVREKIEHHAEVNPMLGHRGCRLGVTHSEITEMQARAILEAALDVSTPDVPVRPEIMVPLVSTREEFDHQRRIIDTVAEDVFSEQGKRVEYRVGTMIEVPRAALQAGSIAEAADFFSFGTNDLTQMTFGFSRDDAGRFLPYYLQEGLLASDPFQTLDREGVGELVRLGTQRGRKVKPNLQIGICGEHGGDPESVRFCHATGLDYVSCSPFRVPVARLAAAQASEDVDQ